MAKTLFPPTGGRVASPSVVPLSKGGVIALGVAGEDSDSPYSFDDYRRMRAAELLRGGFTDDEVGAMLKLPLEDVASIRRMLARIPHVLIERGYGSFGSGRGSRTFFANNAGRERQALGRGPR